MFIWTKNFREHWNSGMSFSLNHFISVTLSIQVASAPLVHYSIKYSFTLIYESFKFLEIKTSMVFNLSSTNNTISSSFFLFFLTINLSCLTPAVIAQIRVLLQNSKYWWKYRLKETKAKSETHPVIADTEISDCLM